MRPSLLGLCVGIAILGGIPFLWGLPEEGDMKSVVLENGWAEH